MFTTAYQKDRLNLAQVIIHKLYKSKSSKMKLTDLHNK